MVRCAWWGEDGEDGEECVVKGGGVRCEEGGIREREMRCH